MAERGHEADEPIPNIDTLSTPAGQILFRPAEVSRQGRRSRRRETLTRTEAGLSWPRPDGVAGPCPMHAGESCDGWFEATADHSRIRGLMALAGEHNRKLANPTGAVSLYRRVLDRSLNA